jgi:hypothetical protein
VFPTVSVEVGEIGVRGGGGGGGGVLPVTQGGGDGVEEAVGEEAGPGRVEKGLEVDALAEGGEDIAVRLGGAFFVEAEEVHLVEAGEFAQKVERALKGAEVYGVGGVGIDYEEAHGGGGRFGRSEVGF